MELERGAGERIDLMAQVVAGSSKGVRRAAAPEAESGHIDAESSVAVLRRCTALAARARVELLTESRRTATEELSALLGTMGEWSSARLEAPDPTMTVLCAAALQDLAARLPDPDGVLAARVEAVLALLHGVMAEGRVVAPA
ncbi:hypothetical protein [uncultured Brachybacterium sp.]|uniref:hypothetical protein n=1 Tax=uncultured Brachybacterium sp. TaxID=189680 RepID=UPI002621C77C|nr:hypothetical protein [uncultured Brachybacterium sp.]